jgi:hypothetical protein
VSAGLVTRARESRDRGRALIPVWVSELVIVALLVGIVVLVNLGMPGAIPSGADGGNWLAVARGLMGEEVMAAAVSYPPLFPLMLSLGIPVFGPLPALVSLALLSKTFLVLTVYVCTRPMGRWYALAVAICSAVAGAQLEAYAWGGYPQLMGTAFALLAVFFGIRWIANGSWMTLGLAVSMALLTLATHTLIAGLLLFAFPLAVVHWLVVSRADRADWKRAIAAVPAVVLPVGIAVVISRASASQAGAVAVINPLDLNYMDSLQLAVRDAPVPWLIVAALGLAAFGMVRTSALRATTLAVGSSWTLVGLGFFFVTGEARSLLLAQLGLLMMATLTIEWVFRWIGHEDVEGTKDRLRRVAFPVLIILMVSMVSAIAAGGLVRYASAIAWYRVADQEILDALKWLNEGSEPGDLVVATTGPNGNPLGWWVQGYGERRTFTGVDPRSLSFPEERANAEIANQIFDPRTTTADASDLLAENGIDFVVVDRRGQHGGWLSRGLGVSLTTLYESPSIAIQGVEPR